MFCFRYERIICCNDVAGEVLGVLCSKLGTVVYQECKENILRLIHSNLERQIADNDDGARQEQMETERLMEKLAGPSQRVCVALAVF